MDERPSTKTRISDRAAVDPRAEIAEGVEIGPFCVVGPDVTIGRGTVLTNNVAVLGHVTIGDFNKIYPGAVIGGEPQDLSYRYGDNKGKLVENASELTTGAILAWMSTANVDTTDLQVQAEAGELLRLARDVAGGGRLRSLSTTKFQGLSRGSRTSSGPPTWFGPTVIVFWLVVWLLGLWHFGRRRTPTPVGSRV